MQAEILSEYGNGHRGPRTVDFNLGRKRGYSADIFYGASYNNRKDELVEIATDLTVRSGLWSLEIAREMTQRGKDTVASQNTSMTFFRKSDVVSGKYIGFSWQEMLFIPTIRGDIPVVYFRLRVFEEQHRRKHLGRIAVQLALVANPEATYLAHRTANPAAALSFMESGVFKEGRRFPWDAKFNTDSLVQQIMMGIFFRERVNGTEIDMVTGVCRADYPELNGAYVPDLNHAPTMEIRRRMQEEFGMIFSRGDSLYVVGELK